MAVLARRGPFDPSLLEAILRAADVRCSQALGVDSAYMQVAKDFASNEAEGASTGEVETGIDSMGRLEGNELEVMQ